MISDRRHRIAPAIQRDPNADPIIGGNDLVQNAVNPTYPTQIRYRKFF